MHWYRSMKSTYIAIPPRLSDSDDEEKVRLSPDSVHSAGSILFSPPALSKTRIPWMISTTFFALSTLYLSLHILYPRPGSFEHGFRTDFHDVRSVMSTEEVTFTGSPSFTKDGEEYVKPQAGLKQYVGAPSAQIDDNWRELTEHRYFLLTADEAQTAWGADYVDFWDEDRGGYLAGLDMFHTLHCLDHLRQSFYPTYYPQTPIHGELHRDHCIDHLRQMIMCYADTTPIPTRFFPGIHQNYIDSDRAHTCRNFQAIRDWTTERFFASELIEEHH